MAGASDRGALRAIVSPCPRPILHRCQLSAPLAPEVVYSVENKRIGFLEFRPPVQAPRPDRIGKALAEPIEYPQGELKAAKSETVVGQELADLGEHHGPLADVESKIAEIAGRIEIPARPEVGSGRTGWPVEEHLAERTRPGIGAAGAGVGRVAARCTQIAPRGGAVEPHQHAAVRRQRV